MKELKVGWNLAQKIKDLNSVTIWSMHTSIWWIENMQSILKERKERKHMK